jgi:hypothetical protein
MFDIEGKSDVDKATVWQRLDRMSFKELAEYADKAVKDLGKDPMWCDNNSTLPKALTQLLPSIEPVLAKWCATCNWLAVCNESWLALYGATEKRQLHAKVLLMEFKKYKGLVDEGKITVDQVRTDAHKFDVAMNTCLKDQGLPPLPDCPKDAEAAGAKMKEIMAIYIKYVQRKAKEWEEEHGKKLEGPVIKKEEGKMCID